MKYTRVSQEAVESVEWKAQQMCTSFRNFSEAKFQIGAVLQNVLSTVTYAKIQFPVYYITNAFQERYTYSLWNSRSGNVRVELSTVCILFLHCHYLPYQFY